MCLGTIVSPNLVNKKGDKAWKKPKLLWLSPSSEDALTVLFLTPPPRPSHCHSAPFHLLPPLENTLLSAALRDTITHTYTSAHALPDKPTCTLTEDVRSHAGFSAPQHREESDEIQTQSLKSELIL